MGKVTWVRQKSGLQLGSEWTKKTCGKAKAGPFIGKWLPEEAGSNDDVVKETKHNLLKKTDKFKPNPLWSSSSHDEGADF